ncbi:MAG: DUF3035 domain-containing protein [Rhodospirillales bacterium]|nr:DUF3035 domain-containing protein [Rhodospirillales bacterium]
MAGLTLVLGALLAGCGDARKTLGLDKNPPDEFKIVTRAPLSLPPDYGLRPPQPGAQRPQEQSVPELARQAVFGAAQRPAQDGSGGESPGEQALLAHAGASRADPDIREIIDRESTVLADADKTFLDSLIFWRKPETPGVVVDAPREAARLRENAALGRSVSDGDTPTIKRRRKGALEGIF